MPINYQGVPNLLGSYEAGQNAGAQDFAIAMEADKMSRQKQKEKDIKDAIAELRKSGIPYNQEESASMAMAAAAGDHKMAQTITAAAMLRLQREKLAQSRYPATVPGQTGTQQQPIVPPESQGPQYQEGLGEQMYNAGQLPSTMETPVMGQVPNPDAWKGQALIAGAHDKELAAQLKELGNEHYQHFPAGSLVIAPDGSRFLVPKEPSTQAHNTVTQDKSGPDGKKYPGGTLWQYNPATSRYDIFVGPAKEPAYAAAQRMSTESLTDKEQKIVNTFVTGIKSGAMAPSQLNTFIQRMGGGASSAKIRTAVGTSALDQGINLEQAEINFKATSSQFAIQRVQLAKTVIPMADKVLTTIDKLPDDLGFVPTTEFSRKLSRYMSNDDIALFEFQKNKMVEEFERMLTGAQMADSRVQRNLELIRTGYSKTALKWMANEVKSISNISVGASTSPMFPDFGGGAGAPTPSGGVKVWNPATKSFDVR